MPSVTCCPKDFVNHIWITLRSRLIQYNMMAGTKLILTIRNTSLGHKLRIIFSFTSIWIPPLKLDLLVLNADSRPVVVVGLTQMFSLRASQSSSLKVVVVVVVLVLVLLLLLLLWFFVKTCKNAIAIFNYRGRISVEVHYHNKYLLELKAELERAVKNAVHSVSACLILLFLFPPGVTHFLPF